MKITKSQLVHIIEEVLLEDNEFEDKGAQSFPFRIFCDMDGVLADLPGAILDAANQNTTDPKQRAAVIKILGSDLEWHAHKRGDKKMEKALKFIYKLLNNDKNFWASLPPMKDAMRLWSFISRFEPFILSSPWDSKSAEGKRLWLSTEARNIDPAPPQSRIILTADKHNYARNKATGAPNILIDDMDKYLNSWRRPPGQKEGGIAIKHISADKTIKQLKAIMEEYSG